MLTSAPGALVKESNVVSIALKLVLSTFQKHKNVTFILKLPVLVFLTSARELTRPIIKKS